MKRTIKAYVGTKLVSIRVFDTEAKKKEIIDEWDGSLQPYTTRVIEEQNDIKIDLDYIAAANWLGELKAILVSTLLEQYFGVTDTIHPTKKQTLFLHDRKHSIFMDYIEKPMIENRRFAVKNKVL